jgi:small conductance mechanosensitive channel
MIPSNNFLNTLIDPATFIGAIFYAIVVLVIAWAVAQLLHIVVCRHLDRAEAKGMDATPFRFIGELGRVLVYVLALLFYMHLIPSLQSLGTAGLASVGVLSLVVGLATQSTLSNLVAGISLVLYRPFRIGDRVQVTAPTGTEIGKVESVDLGYTTLLTTDGRQLVYSNSTIANLTTINFSSTHSHIPCDVPLTLALDSDITKAQDILVDIAKAIPKISRINGCYVTNISSQGSVLTLSTTCLDPGDIVPIKSEVLEKAKKEFDAANLKLA